MSSFDHAVLYCFGNSEGKGLTESTVCINGDREADYTGQVKGIKRLNVHEQISGFNFEQF